MRTVLIGPLPPFRGGIAHHTHALFDAMRCKSETKVISYNRLYPGWLYPGQTDKEVGASRINDPSCEYLIDALNPITWHKALRRINDFAPDLVIVCWWTIFLSPCLAFVARGLRLKRIHVRFLCHNVFDHEAASWKRFLTTRTLAFGSSYVVQSQDEAGQLEGAVGSSDIAVCPHPIESNYLPPSTQLPKRAGLEILFFGFIRPYKGVEDLISAMTLLTDVDVHLTIAGEIWQKGRDAERMLERTAAIPQIETVPRYIDSQEISDIFARADLVVLPYRSVTGSGVLGIAWHFGKPVVATDIGTFRDLIIDGQTGWLTPPGEPEMLAQVLRKITRDQCVSMKAAIESQVSEMTWDRLATQLLHM